MLSSLLADRGYSLRRVTSDHATRCGPRHANRGSLIASHSTNGAIAARIAQPEPFSVRPSRGGRANVLPLSRVRPFTRGCATPRVAPNEPRNWRASKRPHVGSCGELARPRHVHSEFAGGCETL